MGDCSHDINATPFVFGRRQGGLGLDYDVADPLDHRVEGLAAVLEHPLRAVPVVVPRLLAQGQPVIISALRRTQALPKNHLRTLTGFNLASPMDCSARDRSPCASCKGQKSAGNWCGNKISAEGEAAWPKMEVVERLSRVRMLGRVCWRPKCCFKPSAGRAQARIGRAGVVWGRGIPRYEAIEAALAGCYWVYPLRGVQLGSRLMGV